MEDLVAVGVADPGHERLVLEQVLQLARMASDPGPPGLEGQARIVGVGPELLVEAGHRPVEPGRQRGRPCPSGSGPGSGPRRLGVVGRQPVGAPRSRRQRRPAARRRAARSRGRRRSSSAAWSPGAASWNRPVSIGLTTIRSRSRSTSRNLPRRRIAVEPLPDERLELGRRAPDGERREGLGPDDRPPGEGGVEGLGDDGQVGQLGHGPAIVGRENPVLDSPGPRGQDSRRA